MERFNYEGYFGPILSLADALRDSPNRFWAPTRDQLELPHEYVLHLGCNVLRTMHLAEATVAVLKAMNVDFITLGGPGHCCGAIHNMVGDTATGDRISQKTIDRLAGVRPKAVLTYCPTCNVVFDDKVAAGSLRFDLPYLHFTQFVAKNLDRLPSKKPIRRRVALHSHVSTMRSKSDSDHTLSILRSIPELEVVEIPVGEEWGYVCSPAAIEKVGAEVHHAMVAEMCALARKSGCDALVCVYHTCYRELLRSEQEFGIEWLNYVELLAASLDLGPFPPRYKELCLAGDPDAAYSALAPRTIERNGSLDALRRTVDRHFCPGASPSNPMPSTSDRRR